MFAYVHNFISFKTLHITFTFVQSMTIKMVLVFISSGHEATLFIAVLDQTKPLLVSLATGYLFNLAYKYLTNFTLQLYKFLIFNRIGWRASFRYCYCVKPPNLFAGKFQVLLCEEVYTVTLKF